jgi:hypothetical protein
MKLYQINDCELLTQIKTMVQNERDLLVKILHHLREIERRRLFSDLGYKSLFEYAIGELKYSEGQAGRRIQAIRLLKDLPELESKIATGALSLSHVQQAQSFFREVQAAEPRRIITPQEKLEVLEKLENKSVRDAQKELLKINPAQALPKEKERVVTDTTSEVRFLMSDTLKAKLEGVRSLLGTKGAMMTYAELFDAMSDISLSALEAKQFGKKRSQDAKKKVSDVDSIFQEATVETPKNDTLDSTSKLNSSNDSRYISKALKHQIWQRDKGVCSNCRGQRNLNYDHVKPLGLGGLTTYENLRLLCFHCNQRASTKIFGVYVQNPSYVVAKGNENSPS